MRKKKEHDSISEKRTEESATNITHPYDRDMK